MRVHNRGRLRFLISVTPVDNFDQKIVHLNRVVASTLHPTMPSPLAQVQTLERTLTEDPSSPNPLLPLLALARNPSAEVVHKSIWALYRVFGNLIASGRVGGITGNGEPEVKTISNKEVKDGGAREVKAWVRDRLLEFVEILGGLLHDTEAGLRVSLSVIATTDARHRP